MPGIETSQKRTLCFPQKQLSALNKKHVFILKAWSKNNDVTCSRTVDMFVNFERVEGYVES